MVILILYSLSTVQCAEGCFLVLQTALPEMQLLKVEEMLTNLMFRKFNTISNT